MGPLDLLIGHECLHIKPTSLPPSHSHSLSLTLLSLSPHTTHPPTPHTHHTDTMAKSFRQLAGIPDLTASTQDSVLVIVDAQGEYADGHLKITNVATSRPAIQKLYEKYRDAGGHVVHVVHEVSQLSAAQRLLGRWARSCVWMGEGGGLAACRWRRGGRGGHDAGAPRHLHCRTATIRGTHRNCAASARLAGDCNAMRSSTSDAIASESCIGRVVCVGSVYGRRPASTLASYVNAIPTLSSFPSSLPLVGQP